MQVFIYLFIYLLSFTHIARDIVNGNVVVTAVLHFMRNSCNLQSFGEFESSRILR